MSQPAAATERKEILRLLRERIVAYAASRMSRDLAEDLAQEVMLVLHEKYRQLGRMEDLLPVSFQILRFKLVAFRRKAQRRGEYSQLPVDELPLAGREPDPETYVERLERMERLKAAFGKLGERCRELLRLKLEGKSFAEIQEILGAASLNTVYTWDFRCRKHLLELMGGSWEEKR